MLGERTSKLHLPATKVVDGTVYAFVLGERTWKLHLPATKVVDGTVCDLVLGGALRMVTYPYTVRSAGPRYNGAVSKLVLFWQHVLCHDFSPEDGSPLFPLLKF